MDDERSNDGSDQDPGADDPGLRSSLRAINPREDAPGLARIAGSAWVRTAGWTASTALRAGRRVTKAAMTGESPGALISDASREVLNGARRLLGVTELEQRLLGPSDDDPGRPLHERGAALLARSAEVTSEGEGHPAYDRIISEIAPDEARILRLVANEGPQAAIDVRTWRPLGIGSRVTAPGLSMIGQHAGVIRGERVPHYLSNLFRLGLIWFSREQVREMKAYQVLEAQPWVSDAVKEAGRAGIVRRSVRLTPFGQHFCELAIPETTGEFEAIQQNVAE